MECNKDEASRAKSIAEGKLEQKDIFGAKKFALKAQTLYPGLDGISQMLTTLDVYVSAENKINGEVDWYGVLGVNPLADDETIKKQYRKLALMLHPDKNNSIGADGAFKLISEAWNLLSDKAKRLAYNRRRGTKGFQQNVSKHTGGPSTRFRPSQQKVPTRNRGPSTPSRPSQERVPTHTSCPSASSMRSQFCNSTSRTASTPKSQNRSANVPRTPSPAPSGPRTDTFWTICKVCNTHFEYLKIYLNQTLLCPNCQKPFMASEKTIPINFLRSAKPWRRRSSANNLAGQNADDPGRNVAAAEKSGVGQADPDSFRHANYQQGPLPGAADIGSKEPSTAAKGANVAQEAQDKLKRPHTESYASAGWDGCFKKRKLGDDGSKYGTNHSMAQGHSGFETARASGSGSYGFSDTSQQPNSTRELTHLEAQKLLMVKAQKEIAEKLNEYGAETTSMAADKKKCKTKDGNKEKYGYNINIQGHDGNRKNEPSAMHQASPSADNLRIAKQAEKHQAPSADNLRKEYPQAVTMDVPDSDFYDFDVDRSESSFSDNEVWAAYGDNDGMPRLYALISKVVSRDPLELRICWLSSDTNSEFSDIDWVGSGFYKTCGEFRVGGYETCTSINAFSQRINWSKGPGGIILILPQKGDFWALYRNWSSDWSENTPAEVVHKYDVVMVLDDYNEEQGISVAPLVKVAGFRTIFLPDLDSAVKRIPKEEIFRFSHRVPSHFVTRQEAPNAPEGSVELDPAATPLELLDIKR